MKTAGLTRFCHSAPLAMVVLGTAAILSVLYLERHTPVAPGYSGLMLTGDGPWLPAGWSNICGALAADGAIAVGLALLNKQFNFLRQHTWLYISLFFAMQVATPQTSLQFGVPLLLAVALLFAALMLFGRYKNPDSPYQVFTVMMVFSAMTAVDLPIGFYLPVVGLWCIQLRIANLRTALASIFGIAVPWWIIFGLGIGNISDIRLPGNPWMTNPLETFGADAPLTAAMGAAALAALLAIILNFFKTIAYNARSRAMNGAVTTLTLTTIAFAIAGYEWFPVFAPTLNACAALQMAHYFSMHRTERSFIGIFVLIAVFFSISIWQILR